MRALFTIFLLLSSLSVVAQDKETFWEKLARYHDIIDSIVKGSLDSRGMSFETLFKPNLASYSAIAEKINDDLKLSKCQSTDCEAYEVDFANLTNAKLGKAEELRILPNLESFELRRELLKNAKKSIHVLVWGIYDDETGVEFQNLLLDALKANPSIDIRLIVDGFIANIKGQKVLKALDKLSEGKIKIMKWKSRRYRANGNHRKLMVIDSEHVIVGGMNIGNPYSHMNTDNPWRDLDIYVRGSSAAYSASSQFAVIWNRQVAEYPKLEKKVGLVRTGQPPVETGDTSVIFVDQHPGSAVKEAYHNIHTGLVKLFREAKETIDIENAYFIMDPIIKRELKAALGRGVKIRIFTNSDKSVDEAIISMPVMNSARDAVAMGAKVFLRHSTTLHSKYMIVDQKISMVGSFNLHPRSLRFDAENVAVVFDEDFAKNLTENFENGIKEAHYFDDPKLFKVDWNLIGLLTQSFYFDFL